MSYLKHETTGFSFIDKLAYVVENGELEFWEDRKNPPNLSVAEFKLVMARVDEAINLKWIPRESDKGKHGKSGENDCFKFKKATSLRRDILMGFRSKVFGRNKYESSKKGISRRDIYL
jgi:hypothetical protein